MIERHASSGKLWHFPGGLQLPHRTGPSTAGPLRVLPAPQRALYPLVHNALPLQPQVRAGDCVSKGQLIACGENEFAVPLHASISGQIVDIVETALPSPAGTLAPTLVLESDGKDHWQEPGLAPIDDYRSVDRAMLIDRIRQAGIAGMGGAVFPTAAKLAQDREIELLVINGAECEPYISCDDMLLRAYPAEVLAGALILRHLTRPKRCVLAVEDHMHEALASLRASGTAEAQEAVELVGVPSIYPAGGERQLLQTLSGLEVPSGGFPIDIGMLCFNVATARAVHRAVAHGEPMISRIVTVAGAAIAQPCNVEVRLGTPIATLIEFCGGYRCEPARLIQGGPMMGDAVPGDAIPITKASNCILAATQEELGSSAPERTCIRCGDCAAVCPARLLPQQLLFDLQAQAWAQAERHALADCIECGCCAYVCPSHIPLVQYYRSGKDELRRFEQQQSKGEDLRARYARHQERINRPAPERSNAPTPPELPREKSERRTIVAAALARAAERRKQKKPGQ